MPARAPALAARIGRYHPGCVHINVLWAEWRQRSYFDWRDDGSPRLARSFGMGMAIVGNRLKAGTSSAGTQPWELTRAHAFLDNTRAMAGMTRGAFRAENQGAGKSQIADFRWRGRTKELE